VRSVAWFRGSSIDTKGGHEIAETGCGLRHLPSCPKCTNGTLTVHGFDSVSVTCPECGMCFSVEELVRSRVLPAYVLKQVAPTAAQWRKNQ
jgi:uncharacterized protein (DUF983 family)